MMRYSKLLAILLGVIVVGVGVTVFTVYESERALVSRLGKFQTDSKTGKAIVYGPGLHFRIPLIDTVYQFDTRLQISDIQSSRILTSEQKHVMVDLFVKWRIKDFEMFFNRTSGGRISEAERLLQQKVTDGLRAEFGQRTIKNLVSRERSVVMDALRTATDENASNLGITIQDVRIKRIDFPDDVRNNIYERMRTDREKEASKIRAEGAAQANVIRANTDKMVRVTLAEAKRQSEAIRGEGDAKAVEVYAKAYERSPEFYEFYRSLEAYRTAFKEEDMLVLQPGGEFFKYFRGTQPK